MSDFTRDIRWQAGYDYRQDPDPDKRKFGAHSLTCRWFLHGPEGSVVFMFYTGWLPSMVDTSDTFFGPRVPLEKDAFRPMAVDLGHHWDSPTYDGQVGPCACDFRPSGSCYYDGSGLNAEPVLSLLLTEGGEAVWSVLEAEYARLSEVDR